MKRPNINEECPGSCQNFYADLIFVVDNSGSIKDSGIGNWNLTLDFMKTLVDNLDIAHDKYVFLV